VSEVAWGDLKKRADDATKPAPPGPHIVEITKASWKMNSSNNPMYSVQGKIVEGAAEGKTVFNNFNVTVENDYALAIFFRHMDALGLDDAFFAESPSHQQVCEALVGRRAIFTLEIRKWQGQDRNGVTDVQPLTGPQAAMLGVVTPPGMIPGSVSAPASVSVGVPTPNGGATERPPTPTITPTTPPPPSPFDITPPTA
jgi:hypothetical protein